MPAVIQVKRGTASSWTSANTVLAAGEIGFETDTKKMKVGDGSTAWTSLGYTATDGDISSVVAGTGLSGGGTSGAVTLNLSTPVATTNGGTGLSSFTTGDLVYASGSNTLAARSIGSTGQVLTVAGGAPTWATPATASSDFVKISHYSAAANTASPISFNNVFTQPNNTSGGYRYYKIIVNGKSDSGAVQWKLRNGGTDRSDAAYYSGVSLVSASNVHSTQSANASTAWILCDGNPNGWSVDLTLYNPLLGPNAPYNKPQYTALTHSRSSDRGGYNTGFFDQFFDSDGFSIHHAGNFQGTITIYGIKV